MISPGLAGVVEPGYRLPGPSRVPSACVAATYGPPLNTKKDGERVCACAVKLAPAAPLLVTTTCTGPLIASGGVRTLNTKKDGERVCACAVKLAPAAPLLVT